MSIQGEQATCPLLEKSRLGYRAYWQVMITNDLDLHYSGRSLEIGLIVPFVLYFLILLAISFFHTI